MTFYWEFTLGSERVRNIVADLPFAALGQNIFDTEWGEPSEDFQTSKFFERGGVHIAAIGQAFAYLPVANPRWMFPEPVLGGDTILIASGSIGKCVSRVDRDARDGRMAGLPHGNDGQIHSHHSFRTWPIPCSTLTLCYQKGDDMVCIGGMGDQIDLNKPVGQRISNLTIFENRRCDPPFENLCGRRSGKRE